MHYVIGNWKSNKTISAAKAWLNQFRLLYKPSVSTTVILCPSFIHLSSMLDLPFFLGAQDISPFPAGAYTGAIAAEQLAGLVRYALIGHSERRQYFNETDSALQKKVDQLTRYAIKPIYCVQSAQIVLPPAVSIVAYEPPAAIGTGNPADPSFANQIISRIKQANPAVTSGIYGGSVTAENVAAFLRQPAIDGVLIGKPSLDAKTFIKIIGYASQV